MKYFKNADEVEYVFGITLTMEQRLMVTMYIVNNVRPTTNGCWTCSPAYVRKLTGRMDRFELAVDAGSERWPWPTDSRDDVVELRG